MDHFFARRILTLYIVHETETRQIYIVVANRTGRMEKGQEKAV